MSFLVFDDGAPFNPGHHLPSKRGRFKVRDVLWSLLRRIHDKYGRENNGKVDGSRKASILRLNCWCFRWGLADFPAS